jgi:hypothetical protein
MERRGKRSRVGEKRDRRLKGGGSSCTRTKTAIYLQHLSFII